MSAEARELGGQLALACFGEAGFFSTSRTFVGRTFRFQRSVTTTSGGCSFWFRQIAFDVTGTPWRICATRRTGNSIPSRTLGLPPGLEAAVHVRDRVPDEVLLDEFENRTEALLVCRSGSLRELRRGLRHADGSEPCMHAVLVDSESSVIRRCSSFVRGISKS